MEAFSMKTPAIVNNLGALPEVIEDSIGGFIYNNEKELVDAIHKLAENHNLRDELGNNGYQAFLKFWNEEAHLAQYLDLIQKIKEKSNIESSRK